jgi:hypothetical protein
MLPDILKDAEDIALIARPARDRYVFAAKPSLRFAKQAFKQSIADKSENDIPAFQAHWQFDARQGITGSSDYLALRFDQRALRPQGLWLPGTLEGRSLDAQGKLEIGVYRDYGLVISGEGEPNSQLAHSLISQASQFGLQLPLVVPFRALNYKTAGRDVEISLVNSPKDIISGPEAVAQIAVMRYHENYGVCGVGRSGSGLWLADWGGLGYSDDNGRVDWICGKATRKILKQALSSLTERKYAPRMQTLLEKMSAAEAKFKEALNQLKTSHLF